MELPKKLTISDHVNVYKPTEIAIYNQLHDQFTAFREYERKVLIAKLNELFDNPKYRNPLALMMAVDKLRDELTTKE